MPVEPYDGGYFEIIADPFRCQCGLSRHITTARTSTGASRPTAWCSGSAAGRTPTTDFRRWPEPAHLVLDAGPVPLLADWHLRETKPDD